MNLERQFSLNNKASNHLEKGINPITVCIGDNSNHDIDYLFTKFKENKKTQNIKYAASSDYYKKENIIIDLSGYAISEGNEKNKYSEEYYNCIGMAIIGIDKKTNKNISILTHKFPAVFLQSDSLEKNFITQLKDLVSRCKLGTLDAVIFGGDKSDGNSLKEYLEAINTINKISKPILGFEPTISAAPKYDGETSVYLDTENRRLYVNIPFHKDSKIYDDSKPSEIEKELDK
ncbi:MAG: hypothetical protein V4665_01570 [Patescibacteria group bacterium]